MSLAAVKDVISSSAAKLLPRDLLHTGDEQERRSEVLHLGASIDAVLPDGGLPRSAVVEVASPLGLAGATSFAVKACVAAQSRDEAGGASWARAEWCAWIDPWSTLHAPGLHQRGVDLERLLVVRPPIAAEISGTAGTAGTGKGGEAIARCAVRVASSKAFALVVIDLTPIGGGSSEGRVRLDRWTNVVRRLALAVEDAATTVLLLTDQTAHRALPLPVALRIELARDRDRSTRLRIAKDRHGRLSGFTPFELHAVGAGERLIA